MRVLFLSQIVPYPPHGGVLQRGYNIIRELGRSASVHLLAFIHPDVLPNDAAVEASRTALREFCETIEYFQLWPKTSRLHGVAAIAASAFSSQPFSVIAHRSRPFQDQVESALRQTPFDIVHVDTLALAPFVPPASNVPAVVTHHNVESILMARRAEKETRLPARRFLQREAKKLKAFESTTAPKFAINITMSPNDAAMLKQELPELRTAVVPNGVDTEYFAPGTEPESPALVYVGGMNMFANRDAVMHFLHDIWPRVRAGHPDVKFFAVGQDPPAEVLDFAKSDPRVVVTGYVDDIRPFVRQAAVYVVPLRVGGGTRLKVLDGMAMGKAMVSTSIGCEGIDVHPQQHLIVADTPEQFASATLSLLGDSVRRQALGQAARQLVLDRYAWPVVGRMLLDAYQQAAGGPTR